MWRDTEWRTTPNPEWISFLMTAQSECFIILIQQQFGYDVSINIIFLTG